jgi:hypothetical protein
MHALVFWLSWGVKETTEATCLVIEVSLHTTQDCSLFNIVGKVPHGNECTGYLETDF